MCLMTYELTTLYDFMTSDFTQVAPLFGRYAPEEVF